MFMLLFQMFGTVGDDGGKICFFPSGSLVCDVKRDISMRLRAAVYDAHSEWRLMG